MMNSRRFTLVLLAFFGLASPLFAAPDPGKKALVEFFSKIRELSVSEDTAGLVKVARSLFPNRETIEKGLSPHVPDAVIDRLVKWHGEALASSDDQFKDAFNITTEQSEIKAYAATVESLILSAEGSDAYLHFPRGAQFFAHDYTLREDTTYYRVFIKDPEKVASRQYDLIFWDGETWKVLGPIWNLLEAETPLLTPPADAPAKDQREHLKLLKERLILYKAEGKKAAADLDRAMVRNKEEVTLGELQELIKRTIDASKRGLAMKIKIPKLEERILKQNLVVTMLDVDLGDTTLFEQSKPDGRPTPFVKPTTPIALLKRELRFLGIAKSISVKALKDPESLTREELIKHTSKLLELDELMTTKRQKIEALLAEKEPAKKEPQVGE